MLKSAELTVVPSLSEAGGLINIEAQAAGCPVVASKAGGIPEYVRDGISGLLCESENVADLSEKIMRLLGNKKLKNAIVKEGLIHAQKFDWKILGPQYLSLYDELVKEFKYKKLCPDDLFKKMWTNLNK